MKTVEKWRLFHGRRIRGEVKGESFASRALLKVNPETSTVDVQGGEMLRLGVKDPDEPLSIEELAELIAKIREPGVVK